MNCNGERPDWQNHANCAGLDPELFFPEKGRRIDDALAVCAGCTVRDECLDYALEHCLRFGIWGGLPERARRRIRAQRNTAA